MDDHQRSKKDFTPIEFNPKHRLFLMTGRLPRVSNDENFQKRLFFVEFSKEKLKAEKPHNM